MAQLDTKPPAPRRGGRDVLIVARESGETDLLTTTLQLAGYTVADLVGTGAEGLARIMRRRFDLVVWDATLPDLKELARGPRPLSDDVPPLLYLITCDYLHTLLPVLGRRTEDYVTKPVRATEVLARAEVLLRNRRPASDGQASRYADLVIDDHLRQARRGPRPLGLTPAEYRLLRHLLANVECVVSKEQISLHVWGDLRASEAIEKLVSRLRRKVNLDDPALIHTSRGFGYWLGSSRG
ncbi:response regulator transcription factor [Streptomyces sp. NPDC005811]|uniref:response regulator transcription factor n=1 Tax=Streptomyces sp. NPDC005811 TaxID=3154565 RepID=UPI0033C67185